MMTGAQVGKRVQDARLAMKIDPKALATRAGVSEGYLYKLERGEVAAPKYHTISQLAVALGRVGADELIGEPLVTPRDLDVLFDRHYGINQRIEHVLAQAAQDAPLSATRPASKRRTGRAQHGAEPEPQPEPADHRKHKHA